MVSSKTNDCHHPLGSETIVVDLCWADDEPMTPPPSPSVTTTESVNVDESVPMSETLSGMGSGGTTTPREEYALTVLLAGNEVYNLTFPQQLPLGSSIIVETDYGNQWGCVTSCCLINNSYNLNSHFNSYNQYYSDVNGGVSSQSMYAF